MGFLRSAFAGLSLEIGITFVVTFVECSPDITNVFEFDVGADVTKVKRGDSDGAEE